MKFNALFAGLTLCVATSVFAADAPTLNEGVDAEVKAAIEAAQEANKAAKAADTEWIWADPVNGMWTGSLESNSDILEQAITMANEGKNDEAKKAAAYVEMAAKQGILQAEKAKTAGPAQYGI